MQLQSLDKSFFI